MGFPLPDLPNSVTDPQIKPFLEHYYEISNHAPSHDEYAALFTQDGEFAMNEKKAKGREEIRALRKAIWSHIPNRDHSPVQIYTYGDDQYDMMVFGEVSYDHHHPGHQTATEWAARFKLAKEGGEIKVRVCHVIVDSVKHV